MKIMIFRHKIHAMHKTPEKCVKNYRYFLLVISELTQNTGRRAIPF